MNEGAGPTVTVMCRSNLCRDAGAGSNDSAADSDGGSHPNADHSETNFDPRSPNVDTGSADADDGRSDGDADRHANGSSGVDRLSDRAAADPQGVLRAGNVRWGR